MSDSWQGPYKVLKRVGSVNYRIGRVSREKNAKVVHVNCIKEFKERAYMRKLDIVVEEQGDESSKFRGECEGYKRVSSRVYWGRMTTSSLTVLGALIGRRCPTILVIVSQFGGCRIQSLYGTGRK